MHAEDAFDFIVEQLAGLNVATDMQGNRAGVRHADIWMPDLAWKFWQPRIDMREYTDSSRLEHAHLIPFYDAAWELCRIGVLRPGVFAPGGRALATAFGDSYTITEFESEWLKTASARRPVVDPSRLAQVFLTFGKTFGTGYEQRATEAVRTYRTANYLAACVMAGAAGESILLAVAIAKVGDEAKVLTEYNGPSGRRKVTNRIMGGLTASIVNQFTVALSVLHYWRDDASHGVMTTISEIEAHASLLQLLRLAQFASDHWDKLTS
jgi:hypothetical protein